MALQLDEEDWEDKFGMRKPAPEDEIICYCKIGGRSHAAVLYLQQSGFKKVCCTFVHGGGCKKKSKKIRGSGVSPLRPRIERGPLFVRRRGKGGAVEAAPLSPRFCGVFF